MTFSEDHIQSLMSEVEQRERTARQRAFLYAALPVVLAILLVGFTALQIQKLAGVQTELKATTLKLENTNSQYESVAAQADQAQAALGAAQSELERTQAEYQQAVSQLESTRQELDKTNAGLKEAQQKTLDLQAQVDKLQAQVDQLTRDIQDLGEQYSQASTFRRYQVDITEEQIKEPPASFTQGQMALFQDVLLQRFQGMRFNPTGNSPETGFNSPNYAAYVLQQHKALPVSYDFNKKPWEQLPQIPKPDNGDLVFYKSGYTMFYFNAPVEFVVGMTPVGILALRPDVAPVAGYLKVDYP